MSAPPIIDESDASLTRLLGVERRLEEQVRDAERAAAARVKAARGELERAQADAAGAVELEVAKEEAAAAAAHEAALRAVEAERVAEHGRLEKVTATEIDRLARRVLERLIGEGLE